MNAPASLTTFLQALPGEHINVVFFKLGRDTPIDGVTLPSWRAEEIPGRLEALGAEINAYYMLSEPKPKARGTKVAKADVAALRGPFVDVDVPAVAPGSDDFAGLHAAIKAKFTALPEEKRPSYLIDSGGGWQATWLFAEPVEANAANTAMLEAINRRLIIEFSGDPGTWNGDRILRLPFSTNFPTPAKLAKGRTIRPASLVEWSERRYTISRLAEMFPPIAATTTAARNTGTIDFGATYVDRFEDLPELLRDKLQYERQRFRDFDDLWKGERPEGSDVSGSGYLMAMASRLLRAGFAADEFAMVAQVWPWCWGEDGRHREKNTSQRSLERAWGKAIAYAEAELKQANGEAPGGGPEGPDSPQPPDPAEGVGEESTEGEDPSDYRPGHDAGEEDPVGGDAGQGGGDGQGESGAGTDFGADPRSGWKRKISFPITSFWKFGQDSRPQWRVKGLIPDRGLVVIWGPPKSGKSFWTFDLAMHMARGLPYRGRRTSGGLIVYLALEGEHGFRHRRDAYAQRFLEAGDEPPFWLMTTRIDLRKDAGVLVADIKAQLGDARPVYVFIDTLNRSLVGSESRDEDMTDYIRATDHVRLEFDCGVGVVHHCGVNGDRPRGHTSLTGAADVQLAVSKAGDTVSTTIEFVKDGPSGAVIASHLETVELGVDEDGDQITSLVVVPAGEDVQRAAAAAATPKKERLPPSATIALAALCDTLLESGVALKANEYIPNDTVGVTIEQWRTVAYGRGISDAEKPAARQKAFKRAMDVLNVRKRIGVWGHWVWLP